MKFMVLSVDVLELPPWWQEIRHRLSNVMNDLRASILQYGFLHPIIVAKTPESRFIVVDGVTRFLAVESIGMDHIPCIVEEVKSDDELKMFKMAVSLNLAQGHLGSISKLKVVTYLTGKGMSIKDACAIIGVSESWFYHRRFMLELPKELQDMVESGEVSIADVKTLEGAKVSYTSARRTGAWSGKTPVEKRAGKKAPICEICGRQVYSGDRKWFPVHPMCWDMLNDLLHEVLIFSREKNKIMFFCRKCKQMVGRADFVAGVWTSQRTLDSPGGGERDE